MLHNLRRMNEKQPLREPIDQLAAGLEVILGQQSSDLSVLRFQISPLAFRSVTSPKFDPKLRNLHKRDDVHWYAKKKLFPFVRMKSKQN